MTIEVGILIAVAGFILSFVVALTTSKRTTKEDSTKEGYQLGILTQKLNDIDRKLEKIERKLDDYDKDMRQIAEEEVEKHVLEYHKGGVKWRKKSQK